MTALLYIGPFLILLALLTFGLYPGEKLILGLIEERIGSRARAPRRLDLPRPGRVSVPRGSALLATSLAGRAPPL